MGTIKRFICCVALVSVLLVPVSFERAYAGFGSNGPFPEDAYYSNQLDALNHIRNAMAALSNVFLADGTDSLFYYINQIYYEQRLLGNKFDRALIYLEGISEYTFESAFRLGEVINRLDDVNLVSGNILAFLEANFYRQILSAETHTFPVAEGDYAYFYVTVNYPAGSSADLSYRWQYFNRANNRWINIGTQHEGYNADTCKIEATDIRLERWYLRCMITTIEGNVLYSIPVKMQGLEHESAYDFTVDVSSYTFDNSDLAFFNARVDAAPYSSVTYQWQYHYTSFGDLSDWRNVSGSDVRGSTSSLMSMTLDDVRRNEMLVRCVVTVNSIVYYSEPIRFETSSLYSVLDSLDKIIDLLSDNHEPVVVDLSTYPVTDDGFAFFYADVRGLDPDLEYSFRWQYCNDPDSSPWATLTYETPSINPFYSPYDNMFSFDVDDLNFRYVRCYVLLEDGTEFYSNVVSVYNPSLSHVIGKLDDLSFSVDLNVEDQTSEVINFWDAAVGDLDTAAIGLGLTGLSDVLQKAFPFCLVFGLVAIFGLFVADPVAPSFDFPMPDGIGGSLIYTVDLSPFDAVAGVCRALITVVFIIGLIRLTKDVIYKGGSEE